MICRKNAREARTLRPAGIAERTAKNVVNVVQIL